MGCIPCILSFRRETIETYPVSSRTHTINFSEIIHERNKLKNTYTKYNIHSFIHQMNTVQGFGTILSVLFIHENKLHLLQFFTCASLLLYYVLSSLCYNTTMKTYLRTGSTSSLVLSATYPIKLIEVTYFILLQ
jgi:hypothetical protein